MFGMNISIEGIFFWKNIRADQAGTICGTKTSFFGLFTTKMLQFRIFTGKMLLKLNKENTLWHPVFHLKTIVCAG